MRPKLSIKAKRLIFWSSGLAIVTGLVTAGAVAVSKPTPDVNFIVTSSSGVSSLNYIRDRSGSAVFSSLVEGLIGITPYGRASDGADSLSKTLDIPSMTMLGYQRDDTKFDRFSTTLSNWGIRDAIQFTYQAAESASFLADTNPQTGAVMPGTVYKFKIRENALWANGDRVTAEDFVQTIRYIVDLRNSSPLAREFRDSVPIRGATALVQEQEAYYAQNGRYRENLTEYANYAKLFGPNGGVFALADPADPTSEFYAYDGATELSHSYLYYQLEENQYDTAFYTKLGGQMFLPINKRFVDSIGGIDNFGRSKETILSNGPFVLESFAPDYEAVFVRNEDPNNPLRQLYWDVKRVTAKRWVWRVIPEISTQVYLFQQGKVAEVTVTPAYLKVFQESAELKKLTRRGGGSVGVAFFKWNLATPGPDSDVPNAEVINNVHFRRAFSLAINRKAIMDTAGIGTNSKPGDVFANGQFFFRDANNNSIDNYLWRTEYKLNGHNLGKMIQFDPYLSSQFQDAEYVKDIEVDRWQNVEVAREEYEKFLIDMPQYRNAPVNLKVLFSASTGSDANVILRAQQTLREVFGDKINFELEGRPDSAFQETVRQNKGFDLALTTQQGDSISDSWTFLRLLAAPPPEGLKATATVNTTGNWTYADGFKWLLEHEPGRLLTELGFKSDAEVKQFLLLLETIRGSKQATLFGGVLTAMGYSDSEKMQFYVKLEMLIRDQAPVVPLFSTTSLYTAARLYGSVNLNKFGRSYKYAYNAGTPNGNYNQYYSLPKIQ